MNALRLLGWSLIALGTLLCLWWALLTVADLYVRRNWWR